MFFFFQAEDGIRDLYVTGVQTCALPILMRGLARPIISGLTELELPTGERIRSTDPAEGEAVAVVYPWEITLSQTQPADSAQNHIRGWIASLVPIGNRVRVRLGPITAEITKASSDDLELRVGDPAG